MALDASNSSISLWISIIESIIISLSAKPLALHLRIGAAASFFQTADPLIQVEFHSSNGSKTPGKDTEAFNTFIKSLVLKLLLNDTKLPLFKFAIPIFRSLNEFFSLIFFENS